MRNEIFLTALLLIAILQLNFTNAGVSGQVNISIMATPPFISGLTVQQDGNWLSCKAEIMGNNPSDYTILYYWKVNGGMAGEGDRIEILKDWKSAVCIAEAFDSNNEGSKKESGIIISRSLITGNATAENGKSSLLFGSVITAFTAGLLFFKKRIFKL